MILLDLDGQVQKFDTTVINKFGQAVGGSEPFERKDHSVWNKTNELGKRFDYFKLNINIWPTIQGKWKVGYALPPSPIIYGTKSLKHHKAITAT